MFWPFIDARGWLEYCPLADFGGSDQREGSELSALVAVAEPAAAHDELRNASELTGRIALVQRGQCDFVTKALRVQRAGAVAVLVANSPSRAGADASENDSAFVMDAGSPGRHSPEVLAEVQIPVMMMPYNLAAFVLEQTQAATLKRQAFPLTIKFLGAQQAARVLEQRERTARAALEATNRQVDTVQRKEQRERRQREAAKVLRSRLDGLGGSAWRSGTLSSGSASAKAVAVRDKWRTPGAKAASSVGTTSDGVSVASEAFTEPATTRMRRWELEADLFDVTNIDIGDDEGTSRSCSSTDCDRRHDHRYGHSSTSSVSSSFRSSFRAEEDAHRCSQDERSFECEDGDNQSMLSVSGPVFQPLCPMTTALVVLDVQNQFVLREPDALQHTHRHDRHRQREISMSSDKPGRFRYTVENELLPTIQDILLASRACEGIEIIYSIVGSATRDGRERSPAYKRAGIHVTRGGFGAQVPTLISPDSDRDLVLPRPGVDVFEATNLDFLLRNLNISHVVVCGLNVLGSVDACVQSAVNRGYHVTLIADAILESRIADSPRQKSTLSSGDPLPTNALLSRLGKHGTQVVDAAAFVRELHSFTC